MSADAGEAAYDPARDTTLPEGSGSGKRVVFSEGRAAGRPGYRR